MKVNLDRRVYIDEPVQAQSARSGAPTVTWKVHARPWAERMDQPPSRDEALRSGVEVGRTQTRWRMRWREGITTAMRIRDGSETFQIIGGPAEIGRRAYIEVFSEKLSTSGAN